ncbi:MAG: membrane integrity-associated transporter subunit PqiC [Steroidobacteraceae bacterium]|jgi:uncharacterized lipoprotein YmbA
MMRRLAAVAAVCALAALFAGCRSPQSHLYTLSPGASAAGKAGESTSNLAVVVGPVSIPAIVDAPQIAVSVGANQVRLDEFNRWASPLQNNIAHVVVDNLIALLGTPRVSLFPQPLNAEFDYRVAIDVQTFQSSPGEAATLAAMWVVRRVKDGKTLTGRTALREPTQGTSYDALVAAHSRALARLSQDIADAIRTLTP